MSVLMANWWVNCILAERKCRSCARVPRHLHRWLTLLAPSQPWAAAIVFLALSCPRRYFQASDLSGRFTSRLVLFLGHCYVDSHEDVALSLNSRFSSRALGSDKGKDIQLSLNCAH
ncbi:hypothetical protein OBBRIDRAFT_293458 [Obba rivulosa]|uniref:Uncharacterized protein n=1 Tax=Obba rivulosa TaxID=1052685 RepID=A0A8E2DG89_9APHY|nr:hypothetical protein OBBRIDRAFT_293458 [Obba rivulosa]